MEYSIQNCDNVFELGRIAIWILEHPQLSIEQRTAQMQSLLQRAAQFDDIDARDPQGQTLFSHIVVSNTDSTVFPVKEQFMRILLDMGADLNQREARGVTPLMWSVLFNNRSTTDLLLHLGADYSITTPDGKTALDLAEQCGYYDIVAVIRNFI